MPILYTTLYELSRGLGDELDTNRRESYSGGMDKLLTITQAAARLGVHYQTLRKWADKGLVPVVRLPSGYRRFDPAVIDRVRRDMGLGDGDGGSGGA
jgi:excisionase family DNA binding protein